MNDRMNNQSKFTDTVILITGAASGFGKLLAEQLAVCGSKLVLGDIDEAGVKAVGRRLQDAGAQVIAQRCDVSVESDAEQLVASAVEVFGKLDAAVNNAGICQKQMSLIDIDESTFDQMIDVNAKGVLFGMKYQIKQMLNQTGGAIVNISSLAGLRAAQKLGAYSAAKHAVIGLTKTAAAEFGSKNIRVNAVCPFFSLTPMVTDADDLGDKGLQDRIARSSPMRRLGEPAEIVSAIKWLVDPDNSFTNGQAISIDGGALSS